MATFYPINTPLINYFFYKAPLSQSGPNVPLAGGYLFFYDDADHSVMLPTYSDVSDPNNPVVNTNPIQLGQAGECPLFYLNDQLYYIVITDSSGDQSNPIDTISHYNPANGTGSSSNVTTSGNFIANAQFSYPIEFWETENVGLCVETITPIAWGWNFIQDDETETKNVITFPSVQNQEIVGDPINELQILSTNPQFGEANKDLQSIIGDVNFMAGQEVTFAAQFISYLGNTTITILIEKNYGDGDTASVAELLEMGEFEITGERSQSVLAFTIPDNSGKNITSGNYVAIRIRFPLNQICQIGVTNTLTVEGNDPAPVFIQQSYNDEKSQIVGNAIQISNAGLSENYSNYMYSDGEIFPYADTGTMVICPDNVNAPQIFRLLCNGQSLPVNGYTNHIPNSRLYAVIGNAYGGAADLVVTSNNNVITFKSADGAREKSAYTSGTTSFPTPVQILMGLKLGVEALITTPSTLQLTWLGNFAPSQTLPVNSPTGWAANSLVGNYFLTGIPSPPITVVVDSAGSGASQAVATLTFNSNNPSDYMTTGKIGAIGGINALRTCNFLEWATQDTNTQGTYPNTPNPGTTLTSVVTFSYNGSYSNPSQINGLYPTVIPLTSVDILSTIVQRTWSYLNNPFIWELTVNVVPSASQYFLYSSKTVDYYGWFKVDGTGTDPVVAGRTAIEIDINSTDSLQLIAQKIAAATNNTTFSLPQQTDLPIIPTAGSSWYINQ